MSFPSISPKQSFPALESEILAYWKANKTFEKSVSSRPEDNPYRFYDGPPFITGTPHYGSLLSSIVKDVVGRYWTMRGKRVDRIWGWDCHGLPIEEKVQKKLGLASNKEIEERGVKEFIDGCYEYTASTSAEWTWYIDKIGRWVDMDRAYRTMDQDYMESVMWVFKRLWDQGLIYEGKRVSLYSWKLGTPISNFEVAMDDTYQEVNDPAVTVKFRPEFTYGSFAFLTNSEGKILLGKHKKSGTWKIPGGKFEAGETKEQCLEREVREETGITIKNYTLLNTSVEFQGGRAYYGYAYKADIGNITSIENPEPEVFEEWRFFTREEVRNMKESIAKYDHEALEVFLSERAPILDIKDFSLLAWTTTPWTIPANMALAVGKDIDYVLLENNREQFIVAKKRIESVFKGKGNYTIIRELKGSDLVGLSYIPPFREYYHGKHGEKNHRVYHADFITDTDGTGIGHEAPEFGDVDFQLAKKEGIFISEAMDEAGKYTAQIFDHEGLHYQDANKVNIERMKENGTLFKSESITHRVPFCPRSGTPLVQKAQKSWFIDIQSQKEKLLKANEQINWFPEHLKFGRFAKGIESAPDWCISRTRYWGAPMPVWQNKDASERVVISSREEIFEMNKPYGQLEKREVDGKIKYFFTGGEFDGVEFNLHKPYIDAIKLQSPKTEEPLTRIPEVLDVWMDSGSMPYAQMHYPFENKGEMEASFPADFIAEYVGQVRAWFYVMHVLGVLVNPNNEKNPTPSFTNVITTGVINGNDGRKMSKSYGNYPDPRATIEKYGADPIRFYMLNSPLLSGGDMDFKEEQIIETVKGVMLPLWNTYSFFTTYANIDKWEKDDAEIWCVRHGQTTTNESKKVNGGGMDTPLTELGIEQARERGKFFRENGIEFDMIITTSKLRTKQTAEHIAKELGYTGEFIEMPEFSEQNMGEFEGRDHDELKNEWVRQHGNDIGWTRIYRENTEEPYKSFLDRVENGIKKVKDLYKGKRVLIIAHGGTGRALATTELGYSYDESIIHFPAMRNGEAIKLPGSPIVNPLDRWIISKLQVLMGQVHDAMDGYDISRACRAIVDYMDHLTNWYVRLSRRRFWETGMTPDKASAYETLYTVLLEVSKLLAPFMPFISESIFRGLTKKESVHLEYTSFPSRQYISNDLNRDMERCEQIVSLGLALRSRKNIRVRQPLTSITITETLDEYYEKIIKDELNVKEVKKVNPSSLAKKIAKPDAKKIGPKYGKNVQEIIMKAKNGEFEEEENGIKVGEFFLEKEEYILEYLPLNAGDDVEGGYGMVISLDTHITEELKLEGYARDIVRLIQDMRKEANYQVTDRINIAISGEGKDTLLNSFGAMIAEETLGTLVSSLDHPDITKTETIDETLTLSLSVALR